MQRILLCIGMISATVQAETCPVRSTNDVVSCVVANHPNVLDLDSELKVTEAGVEKANQRPNPSLSSEFAIKNQGDLRVGAGYTHIIERGGKLDARLNLARSEIEVSRSKIRGEQERVALEALDRLFAISQINETCELIHEILAIYNSGLAKYNNQQFLSPEIEVERDILKVAREEMMSRESINNSEKAEHKKWLAKALGHELPEDEKLWVPKVDNWKDMPSTGGTESAQSIYNHAKLTETLSKITVEESTAHSDIGVGPVVEIEREDTEWKAGIGVGFSMDLPVYHRNEGAILVARKENEAAQLRWKRQKDLEQANLEILQEKYQNAVTRLTEIEQNKQAKRLHDIIDKRSKSGLFRPQTIIEAHRQLVESLERKQEIELIAVNAKWQMSIINGTLVPGKDSSNEKH